MILRLQRPSHCIFHCLYLLDRPQRRADSIEHVPTAAVVIEAGHGGIVHVPVDVYLSICKRRPDDSLTVAEAALSSS